MSPFLHAAPVNNLEFPETHLGEDSFFTPTIPDRAEWTTIHLFPTEGCSLLGGHPTDFDIANALVLGANKRSELPSTILVLFHSSLWSFFAFWEGWWQGLGTWEGGGTKSISLLSGSGGLSINQL